MRVFGVGVLFGLVGEFSMGKKWRDVVELERGCLD